MRTKFLFVSVALVGSMVPACGDESDEIVTTADVQAQIFTPTCAISNCHVGPSPRAGLDLSATGSVRDRLVNQPSTQSLKPLVAPGDLGNSYLYDKVVGAMLDVGLERMPFGGPPLSQSELDLIADWIIDGAPDF